MASETVSTHQVPKHLVTSPNLKALVNDWDYTYGTPETTFEAGDLLILNMGACPKRGDVVVMCREGGKPFGRQCYAAPLAQSQRWSMGVLDHESDAVYMFDLAEYAWFGVVAGKVPAADRRA